MSNHLELATPDVKAQVQDLGADEFLAALRKLVEAEEEWVTEWFDAEQVDLVAEEIVDWSVANVVAFHSTVAYVELGIVLSTYARPVDDDTPGQWIEIPAFARVLLGPPLTTDRMELHHKDMFSWVAADTEGTTGLELLGNVSLKAEVAEYLERSGERRPSRGTAMLRETERSIEVSGLPGPERDPHEPTA